MVLYTKLIKKSHMIWPSKERKEKKKRKEQKEKHFEVTRYSFRHKRSYKQPVGEMNRRHSYSIGYNALLNGVQYMAQLGEINVSGRVIFRESEHTINAQATVRTHVSSAALLKHPAGYSKIKKNKKKENKQTKTWGRVHTAWQHDPDLITRRLWPFGGRQRV